jgi:hypothetical protein
VLRDGARRNGGVDAVCGRKQRRTSGERYAGR